VVTLVEELQFNRNKANKEETMRILAKYLRVLLERKRARIEERYEIYRDMMLKKSYAAMKVLLEMIGEYSPTVKNINVAAPVASST
jgi:hypothetical protein